jgi:hypothetical protein
MVALLAIVGLAVDGGSIYGQRRAAQNAADGAALAGARVMLDAYEQMAGATNEDVDGSAQSETDVRNAIVQYVSMNGVPTGTLQAYFVDDNKQLVTVSSGTGGCGSASNPCPVGKNGSIPWTLGARGIIVTNRAQTGSIFFRVFGVNEIGATATAAAFMGVAADSSPELAISPITFRLSNGIGGFKPGQSYTLMQGDSRYDEGPWGAINYNSYTSLPVAYAWMDCGYKPSLGSVADWNRWCGGGGHGGVHGYGPTQYWTGDAGPDNGPYFAPRLQWGEGTAGWWLAGDSLTARDNCDLFELVVEALDDTNQLLPMYDANSDLGGNAAFHLRVPAWFHVENSYVNCHVPDPDGGGGEHAEWHVEGTFMQKVAIGSSGVHGDMRHNSLHVVFLEH